MTQEQKGIRFALLFGALMLLGAVLDINGPRILQALIPNNQERPRVELVPTQEADTLSAEQLRAGMKWTGRNLIANCIILEQEGENPAPSLEHEFVFCQEFIYQLMTDESWRNRPEIVNVMRRMYR